MARTCTVRELADALGADFRGDGAVVLTAALPLDQAGDGAVSFLANLKYRKQAEQSRAACLITSDETLAAGGRTVILAGNPGWAFARTLAFFHPEEAPEPGISPHAALHPTAVIGKDVAISPFVTVEAEASIGDRAVLGPGCYVGRRAVIGEATRLGPNVVVMADCRIGRDGVLHAGVVVGSDGFGFVLEAGEHKKVPQVGGVIIGDDVEIGANSTIDRGSTGPTVIGNNVKIDNLVQIAHNCVIGDHTVIAAQSGLSGSTKVGQYVALGGQTGTAGHLTIGDLVMAGGRAGITKDVPPGKVVSGVPAMDHQEFKRRTAALGQLPEALKTIRALKRRVAALEAALGGVSADPPEGEP